MWMFDYDVEDRRLQERSNNDSSLEMALPNFVFHSRFKDSIYRQPQTPFIPYKSRQLNGSNVHWDYLVGANIPARPDQTLKVKQPPRATFTPLFGGPSAAPTECIRTKTSYSHSQRPQKILHQGYVDYKALHTIPSDIHCSENRMGWCAELCSLRSSLEATNRRADEELSRAISCLRIWA